jgi:hypothetical protein
VQGKQQARTIASATNYHREKDNPQGGKLAKEKQKQHVCIPDQSPHADSTPQKSGALGPSQYSSSREKT